MKFHQQIFNIQKSNQKFMSPSVVTNIEFKIQLRWLTALASKFQQVLKIIPKYCFSLS